MKIHMDVLDKKLITPDEEMATDEVEKEDAVDQVKKVRCGHCRLSEMQQKERMDLLSWRVNITFGLACLTFLGVGVLVSFVAIQRSDVVELQDKYNNWLFGGPVLDTDDTEDPFPVPDPSHTRDYDLDTLIDLETQSTGEDVDHFYTGIPPELGAGYEESLREWDEPYGLFAPLFAPPPEGQDGGHAHPDDVIVSLETQLAQDGDTGATSGRSRRATQARQVGLKVQHLKPAHYIFEVPDDGRTRNWTDEGWSTGGNQYDPRRGTMRINATAIYLVYVQLTYQTRSTDVTYGLYREPEVGRDELLRVCAQGGRAYSRTGDDDYDERLLHDEAVLQTCSMVSTLSFNAGDKIYLKKVTGGDETHLLLIKQQSFWGLVQLTSEMEPASQASTDNGGVADSGNSGMVEKKRGRRRERRERRRRERRHRSRHGRVRITGSGNAAETSRADAPASE